MNKQIVNSKLVKINARGEIDQQFYPYYEGDKARMFIFVDIYRSYEWLKKCANYIRETDYFFVRHHWDCDFQKVKLNHLILTGLKLNLDNFFIFCNTTEELKNYIAFGFKNCFLLNNNAWIDEYMFTILPEKKIYNAILVARAKKFKRPWLASKVKNLAYLPGKDPKKSNKVISLPPQINTNFVAGKDGVCRMINQSYCGLSLSKKEGACYASSEYLLCGVPVVSTKSTGGRDVWYTEENSIICEANEDSVEEAVNKFIFEKKVDPISIRNNHLTLSMSYRQIFIDITEELFKKHDIKIDAKKYFLRSFRNKMHMKKTFAELHSYFIV